MLRTQQWPKVFPIPLFSYAYTTDADFSDVAEALTRKHPCLREPGSLNEGYGWKQRLEVKMANYRTLLRTHGTSAELTVNSLKSKSPEEAYPAKNLKRPRRAEVIFHPCQVVRLQKAWNKRGFSCWQNYRKETTDKQ